MHHLALYAIGGLALLAGGGVLWAKFGNKATQLEQQAAQKEQAIRKQL